MVEEVTTFLEHPWVKRIAESKYMIELLRFLRIGRKTDSIIAKFPDIPPEYILGALEALESLEVIKSIDVSGEKFYVLSSQGKLLLSYVEDLAKKQF